MGGKRPDPNNVGLDDAGSSDEKKARELRARQEASRRGSQGGMSDDDRVDEASEESFPASDPPAQP